jgi:hypothetical protein
MLGCRPCSLEGGGGGGGGGGVCTVLGLSPAVLSELAPPAVLLSGGSLLSSPINQDQNPASLSKGKSVNENNITKIVAFTADSLLILTHCTVDLSF